MPDTDRKASSDHANGKIVTFYSYKGGAGRTTALANVAWILAANGRRVLVADWDLEAPGLHRFFHPFIDEEDVRNAAGIIDLIRQYERSAIMSASAGHAREPIGDQARVQRYALALKWDFPPGGCLDFLPAGRMNFAYAATLASLDWDNFYERLNGGEFLDAVRADMKRYYDYCLIDSRSGLSDIAGICTIQLPDVLVDCFALSTQAIEGAVQVAETIREQHRDRSIRILPVPMRVDQAEKEKVEAGTALAMRLFTGLPAGMSDAQRREYWAAVEVPYRAFYAYEEILAVFGDAPGSPASLLASFERLAAQITEGDVSVLPTMDERTRVRVKQLFTRSVSRVIDEVIVEHAAEDEHWAEWIADLLSGTGVPVRARYIAEPGGQRISDPPYSRRIAVVTASYVARHASSGEAPPELAVYVTAARPFDDSALTASAVLAGLPEREAAERICRLLGIALLPRDAVRARLVRYPGSEPQIDRLPPRNPRFVGREHELRQLREQLSDYGSAISMPVNLHGLGGVGKTQLALEYAHRFKSDYDLLWWFNCGHPQSIDGLMEELAIRLHDVLDVSIPVPGNSSDATRQVLDMLSAGKSGLRWLLIFDNAEDVDAIRPYLPSAGGQIVITSRNRAWANQTRSMAVDVFARSESVRYLLLRVPSLSAKAAGEVAETLGDLPLAVAVAGAWLAESGADVNEYLSMLSQQAASTLAISHFADYSLPVSNTWDLSLTMLKENSPAAARLFELCSLMAPSIASELLFSRAMVALLASYNPALSEPMMIGRLVQEINRLALIELDTVASQIHVHPIVQSVVRDRMSPDALAAARQDVHQLLAEARPASDVDDPEASVRFAMIWPHLAPSGAATSAKVPVRQLCIDWVRYLWQHHDLERGGAAAFELGEEWSGMLAATADVGVAAALRTQLLYLRFHRAGILRDQGSLEEARTMDQVVLLEQRELLGPEHPHTLMTAGGLAADLRSSGRYAEALEMDEITYETWVTTSGEDNAETLTAANSLAASCRLSGDFARALQIDENVLRRRRITLGPSHPRMLASGVAVVRDLLGAGRYSEAAARMDEIHGSYAEALGPDSFAALNSEVVLAIALRCLGQSARAESHFAAAQDGLIRHVGSSGGVALTCQLGHALNLLSLSRVAEAQVAIRQVLAVYEKRLGPAHPNTLACLIDLAAVLREHGDPAALGTAQLARERSRETLGGAHPRTLIATMALGALLADRKDGASAARVEAQAAEGLAIALGPEHPDTLRCRANLLLSRQQTGDSAQAAQRMHVIELLAGSIGDDHPDVNALRRDDRLMPTLDSEPD